MMCYVIHTCVAHAITTQTHLRLPVMMYSPRLSLSKPNLMVNERKKVTPSGVERATSSHVPSSSCGVNVCDVAKSCRLQVSGISQPSVTLDNA